MCIFMGKKNLKFLLLALPLLLNSCGRDTPEHYCVNRIAESKELTDYTYIVIPFKKSIENFKACYQIDFVHYPYYDSVICMFNYVDPICDDNVTDFHYTTIVHKFLS
jgi:hypothetical protein